MKAELLKISEYAKIQGISPQAVYKQLNNKLKKYVVVVDNQKYLNKKVLEDTTLNQVKQQVDNNFQQFNNSLIPLLEKQIEEKDKQIKNLFSQIEEKDKQIENLYRLLEQSQQLQLVDRKLFLDSKSQKKKGFLGIFKKKEIEENERNI